MAQSRSDYFLDRAKSTDDAAASAEALGFKEIAQAYRKAARLWREMAEKELYISKVAE